MIYVIKILEKKKRKYNGRIKTLVYKLLSPNFFYVVSFNISLSSSGLLRISRNE